MATFEGQTLVLGLILGLRHGLDPDHIAVIDNLAFRMADRRSPWTGWVGALFALGHSLSVAVVAVGVSLAAIRLPLPPVMAEVVDWGVIALMALVAVLNLRALKRPVYTPVGWKQTLAPGLAKATHPLGVFAIGVVFGLVFDTASQAAAWGLAASASGGLQEVLMLCLVFGAGMTLTDTVDSQLVARLLRTGGRSGGVQAYRRGVGWLIVALSLGMAGFGLARKLTGAQDLPDMLLTALGLTMALTVVAVLLAGRPKAAAN